MSYISDLVEARKRAIDAGDKALGREIYHQLQEMGVEAEAIDGTTFTDVVDLEPNVDRPAPPEPEKVDAPEKTEKPSAPEKAVKPEPKHRRR